MATPAPRKFTIYTPPTDAEKQRIRAARLAMFEQMKREALDG